MPVNATREYMTLDKEDGDDDAMPPCPYCGAPTLACDVLEVMMARQTHWSPAEYETFCDACLPARYRERDPDQQRDERRDR